MEATAIIKRPIITEKSTEQSETKRYAFLVERGATKPQIKEAVETIYGVRVLSVATQNRPGKLRRARGRLGLVRTSPTKRALVKVHPDDRIELF